MKKQKWKTMIGIMALLLMITMMPLSAAEPAKTPTDAEIERRIEEVGASYDGLFDSSWIPPQTQQPPTIYSEPPETPEDPFESIIRFLVGTTEGQIILFCIELSIAGFLSLCIYKITQEEKSDKHSIWVTATICTGLLPFLFPNDLHSIILPRVSIIMILTGIMLAVGMIMKKTYRNIRWILVILLIFIGIFIFYKETAFFFQNSRTTFDSMVKDPSENEKDTLDSMSAGALEDENESVSAPQNNYNQTETADVAENAGENIIIPPDNPTIDWNTESYENITENGFIKTENNRFSTFGADVDTASYSQLRQLIYEENENGNATGISPDAIRIEEMVNYFDYNYPKPKKGEKFSVTQTIGQCPWNKDTYLYKAGIRAEEKHSQKGSNIVFLIDTSGSMMDSNKLPLAIKAFDILQQKLTAKDRISMVTYAGSDEIILDSVPGNQHGKIKKALENLYASGSTNGAGGINTAYELAVKNYIKGGNNRVILATDGDFNVGITSEADLIDLVSEKKKTDIFLSCLGFGEGNYMDDTMEALADNGNGNYAYIDCTAEAKKVLDKELNSTIFTIAKDTKFQVEFNPETVAAYRLIGYENRKMDAEDFADDTKDGGEVGAGQTVTVLYEIVPKGSAYENNLSNVESRYNQTDTNTKTEPTTITGNEEYCVLNLRYKETEEAKSQLKTYPVTKNMFKEKLDDDTVWAAGVVQTGMLIRQSEYKGTSNYQEIYDTLKYDPAVMKDDFKAGFLYLIKLLK